jgi:hypothetical protein
VLLLSLDRKEDLPRVNVRAESPVLVRRRVNNCGRHVIADYIEVRTVVCIGATAGWNSGSAMVSWI